ncbi:MAG TPA: hypothetical protein VMY05_02930 [Acidobacteriota bacterium]|nr:hypothetical protein [Acidobacteriota bacterium]
MSRQSLAVLVPVAIVLGLAVERVPAQESAAIQATASVTTTLSITGTQNLRFNVVTPGINKTVDKSTIGQAGEWAISGTVNSEITLNFTLPDSLQHALQPVGMNIGFNAIDASFDDGTGGGQTLPSGVLNPNGPSAERLGPLGTMTVWIGGTVFPDISQTGGNYASDVVLTVAYTGS